jgi:hypothetical protein
MNRIRIIGLAVVAVFAMSAVAAASASAFTMFEAAEYPVKIKAEQKEENVFQIGTEASGKVTCKKATFTSGAYAAATPSVKVVPVYSECTVFGVVGGEVKMNGCEYELFANEGRENAKKETGFDVKVVCPGLNVIEVTAALCVVKVGSQELSKVKYVNLATVPTTVEVVDEVAKIGYKSNLQGVCPTEGKEATYKGTERAEGVKPTEETKKIGIKVK